MVCSAWPRSERCSLARTPVPGVTGRLIGLAIGRYAGTQFFERTEADGNENRQAHGTDCSIGVCARRCDAQRWIWFLKRPRDDCDIVKSVKLPLEGEALLRPPRPNAMDDTVAAPV